MRGGLRGGCQDTMAAAVEGEGGRSTASGETPPHLASADWASLDAMLGELQDSVAVLQGSRACEEVGSDEAEGDEDLDVDAASQESGEEWLEEQRRVVAARSAPETESTGLLGLLLGGGAVGSGHRACGRMPF